MTAAGIDPPDWEAFTPPSAMRSWRPYFAAFALYSACVFIFGLKRFALGIDFTDEGAYLSWPLRLAFGESPFTSELMTMTRPVEVFISRFLDFGPASSLFGLRLLGWIIHLVAFGVLGAFLYQIGGCPWRSVLIAGIPLFLVHVHGLATPAYNVLSSDFLVVALSLRGIAALAQGGRRTYLHAGAGVFLFMATVCHPGLGLVAVAWLIYECWTHGFVGNLGRRSLTPSNVGLLVFLSCWTALAAYLVASSAAGAWFERLPLIRSFSIAAARENPVLFVGRLLSYLGTYHQWATAYLLAALSVIGLARLSVSAGRTRIVPLAWAFLGGLTLVFLLGEAVIRPEWSPSGFALVTYLLVIGCIIGRAVPELGEMPELRVLMVASGFAGLVYATSTYFFTPLRSWMSGALGLPFAFALGLEIVLGDRCRQVRVVRLAVMVALTFLVGWVARNHYVAIFRDAPPRELTASFDLPKLRHIKSTPERVQALNSLHAYMRPRIATGESLLVYDDGPLLYYLFDAKPVYGLTWAIRYGQSREVLEQLSRELQAGPLPNYAIRLLVDPSYTSWEDAPRVNYGDYPLDAFVLSNYVLERTIHPFEIWRRR